MKSVTELEAGDFIDFPRDGIACEVLEHTPSTRDSPSGVRWRNTCNNQEGWSSAQHVHVEGQVWDEVFGRWDKFA